jgi:hypothetical protein
VRPVLLARIKWARPAPLVLVERTHCLAPHSVGRATRVTSPETTSLLVCRVPRGRTRETVRIARCARLVRSRLPTEPTNACLAHLVSTRQPPTARHVNSAKSGRTRSSRTHRAASPVRMAHSHPVVQAPARIVWLGSTATRITRRVIRVVLARLLRITSPCSVPRVPRVHFQAPLQARASHVRRVKS